MQAVVYESSRIKSDDGTLFVKSKFSILEIAKNIGNKINRKLKDVYTGVFFLVSPLPTAKKRLDRELSRCYTCFTNRIFKHLVSVVRQY